MKKVVYFIENLSQINCFLSLYSKDDENWLVLAENQPLKEFVRVVFPQEKVLTVERIPYWENDSLYKEQIVRAKQNLSQFECLTAMDQCVFFNEIESLHFHIIVDFLSCEGVPVYVVDAFKRFRHLMPHVPYKDLNTKQQDFLDTVNALVGFDVHQFRVNHTWDMFGLIDLYEKLEVERLSWHAIAQKLEYSYDTVGENPALLIDAPIHKFGVHGIDLEATQDNVVNFFSQLVDDGVPLYVKPNPSSDRTSIDGTLLEKKVHFIQKNFPVELIMHQFSSIYFFSSSTSSVSVDGQMYCLMDLVQFDDRKGREEAYEILLASLGSNYERTEFVASC